MKIHHCFFIFLYLLSFSIPAQEITMSGTLIDSLHNRPIEFVNIGIPNKNQGTITDTNGKFNFSVPKEFAGDTVFISHLNYYPIKILVENFNKRTFFMEPKTLELKEVVVVNRKRKTKKIGVKSYNRFLSMQMISKSNDIIEAAQRINIPKREVWVKAINFATRKWSKLERVKVRINFYENVENAPGNRIIKKNIV